MESGAVICLQPEVFKIGRTLQPNPSTTHRGKYEEGDNRINADVDNRRSTTLPSITSKPNSAALQSSLKKPMTRGILNGKYRTNRPSGGGAAVVNSPVPMRTGSGKRASEIFYPNSFPPDNADAAYNLKMVFMKDTSYLAIPYRHFSKILHKKEGRVRLVLPKIAKEWFLAYSNNAVKEHITRLIPWIIENNIDFEPKVIPPKPTKLDF